MTRTRNSKIFRTAASIAACIVMTITSAAYSQGTSPPDHDPDATLNGKTALDHAEGLARSHPMYRLDALQALAQMETNAWPARDAVRTLAEQARDPKLDDRDADDLRIGALSVLISMQAPGAATLVRKKILDPDYFARDEPYSVLLSATGRIGIADKAFQDDLLTLVDRMPDHATRLMALDALADPVQAALEEAVFNTDHGAAASEHFFANLTSLAFLDDAARLAYIVDHRQIAERQAGAMLDVLADIGTQAAMNLALELGGEQGEDQQRTISRFGGGAMPAQEIADRFLTVAQAKSSEPEIRQVLSILETTLRDIIAEAETPEDRARYRHLFLDTIGTLIADGPTDTHVLVGVNRQILYLQRHDDLPLAPALGPVFDLLEAGGASPSVYNGVAQSLKLRTSRIAGRDPEYFISRTLALLWRADTPELAKLPIDVLTALMRERGHAEPVVAQIAAEIAPYKDSWVINPAAAIAMFSGTLPRLAHTPARQSAGAVMGEAIASPALDMDFLGPHFARGGGALATLDHNTVEGVIAVFSPTIFAKEKPATYPFSMQSFMQPMLGKPAWLQQNPEALATWVEFLERVAALDDADFSPIARQAITKLAQAN